MTEQSSRSSFDVEVKPHAYDPVAHPELFEGVSTRRVLAFIVDVLIISIPVLLACIFIFLFGIFTFGLGWLLFWLVSPAAAIWAILYYGITMGSPASATYGMRAFDLEIRTWYGGALLFPARCGARDPVLDLGFRAHPVHRADRTVQRAAPATARLRRRHRHHQFRPARRRDAPRFPLMCGALPFAANGL